MDDRNFSWRIARRLSYFYGVGLPARRLTLPKPGETGEQVCSCVVGRGRLTVSVGRGIRNEMEALGLSFPLMAWDSGLIDLQRLYQILICLLLETVQDMILIVGHYNAD